LVYTGRGYTGEGRDAEVCTILQTGMMAREHGGTHSCGGGGGGFREGGGGQDQQQTPPLLSSHGGRPLRFFWRNLGIQRYRGETTNRRTARTGGGAIGPLTLSWLEEVHNI